MSHGLGWLTGVLVVLSGLPLAASAAECADEGPQQPHWVFCHDFEEPDSADFSQYWNDVYGAPDRLFLIEENPPGIDGGHAMRTQAVNETGEALDSGITAGPKKFFGEVVDWDAFYYRKYVRFNEGFAQGNFMHMGGLGACIPADYPWDCMGHSGERPDGDDRFSSNLEPWSAYESLDYPGRWGFYSYYHEMYMDCGHPTEDDCYGDMFAPEPDVLLSRGEWHVLEMMIQPNTPGSTDGFQEFWVDGAKAYTSPMINWRTTDELRINKAGIYLYVHNVPANTSCILDFDNVVFGTAYIGPSRCVDGVELAAPCLCGGDPDPEDASDVHAEGYCCEGTWEAAPCGTGGDDDSGDDDGGDDDGGDDDSGDDDGGDDDLDAGGGCDCQVATGPSRGPLSGLLAALLVLALAVGRVATGARPA